LVAGCGGGALVGGQAPVPEPKRPTYPPPELVVLDWSDALNHGLNADAATFFAEGARVVAPDGRVVVLYTREEAERFNASVVCQGRVNSMSRSADRVTVSFILDNRGTFACPVPGAMDTSTFTVRQGKIVAWVLDPDE
jgi:hypothetical protein